MFRPAKTVAIVSTLPTCVISRLTLSFFTFFFLLIKQPVKVQTSHAHMTIVGQMVVMRNCHYPVHKLPSLFWLMLACRNKGVCAGLYFNTRVHVWHLQLFNVKIRICKMWIISKAIISTVIKFITCIGGASLPSTPHTQMLFTQSVTMEHLLDHHKYHMQLKIGHFSNGRSTEHKGALSNPNYCCNMGC